MKLAALATPIVSGNNNRPYPGATSGQGLTTQLKSIATPKASQGGAYNADRKNGKNLKGQLDTMITHSSNDGQVMNGSYRVSYEALVVWMMGLDPDEFLKQWATPSASQLLLRF
jgi:hypothetical protein